MMTYVMRVFCVFFQNPSPNLISNNHCLLTANNVLYTVRACSGSSTDYTCGTLYVLCSIVEAQL